jgi:hypothetical protein
MAGSLKKKPGMGKDVAAPKIGKALPGKKKKRGTKVGKVAKKGAY